MTKITSVGEFSAFFVEDERAAHWRVKSFVVKQSSGDTAGTHFEAYFNKRLRGFLFRFSAEGEFKFTRLSLFKELRKKYRTPFFMEGKE